MAKQEWNKEIKNKIIVRAWKDEKFRNELMNNPKKALKTFGLDIPANVDLKVVCDDPTHLYFVLPQDPSQVKTLSEAELELLAAGDMSDPTGCIFIQTCNDWAC